MIKIGLINHGCAKNLVDSELMLGSLVSAGFEITLDENDADVVIINTCSFIHDAEEESVVSILETIDKNKKVIVTGCLPQKHQKEMLEAIPEAVAFLGTSDIEKIVQTIKNLSGKTIYDVNENPNYIYPEEIERQQITVGSSTYIKIAEGCDYSCGYCIIPQLRGKYNSRTIENIVKEAKSLGQKGVSEIVLIAQDTTNYGKDIYGKPSLAKLLAELNKVEEIEWIRVMYAYPSLMQDELLEAFNSLDKVVKYIDIPLQHSHPEMLKRMHRPAFDYTKLINNIREKIKDVAIRTAFIVGYPGETEEEFEHLYNFVKEMRFDRVGVFEYSHEKNTYSYDLENQVEPEIATKRKEKIMQLQQEISLEINQNLIGKKLPSIVEAIQEDGLVVARTYKDAPEIDGFIYVDTDKALLPGDIEEIEVKNSDVYDLYGTL